MFSEDSKYTHEKKERFTDEYATTSKYKFTKHTQSNFWEEFSMRFISPTDLYKNYDSNQRAEELLLLPIHYIALYAHGIFLQHSSVDIKNIHLRHSHQKFIDTYNKFKKDI
jgi:glutamate-1-semialdehyde aminotransferase